MALLQGAPRHTSRRRLWLNPGFQVLGDGHGGAAGSSGSGP